MLNMWRPGYQISVQPLLHNLLFLLSRILQAISGGWKARQLLMQDGGQLYNYQGQQEEVSSMQVC